MADNFDCDVLIVGGGPVGVALAGLLSDAGHSVIVCEQSEEIYPLPRAAHLDHEVMRILQSLGVIDRILPHTRASHAYEFRTADGRVLMRFENNEGPAPGGWPASNMIHQPSIELALREKLRESPRAELRIPWRFVSLEQEGAGVTAQFAHPAGESRIRARYLVGCDGSSSAVRKSLDIALFDYDFDEPWLVVDVRVGDAPGLPTINLQICDPARPTTCVLMGPGRHRWEFMLKPGESPDDMLNDGVVEGLLASWNLPKGSVIERKAVYRFHALVANEWRKGRVLLAGDSAHQMPPFAGQGLCSGLRDAANLGWKLAAVLKGEASEKLLDSYQTEREPHVRAIIDLALMMGRTVCVLDLAAAAARNSAMLAAQKAGNAQPSAGLSPPLGRGCLMENGGALFPQPVAQNIGKELRLDDELGPSAWLISNEPLANLSPPPDVQAVSLTDERLAPFRDEIQRWMKKQNAEAALIRPDRYVFGTGNAKKLLHAYSEAIGASAMAA